MYLHIPRAPHTYDFVVLTSLTHPRKKILLLVLQIGNMKSQRLISTPTYIRPQKCRYPTKLHGVTTQNIILKRRKAIWNNSVRRPLSETAFQFRQYFNG
jgi:hypothetical protein